MKWIRILVELIIHRPIDDNWRVVKTLYHGSPSKIKGDVLNINPAHINGLRTGAVAVFATSDFSHALAYGAMTCIGDGWKIPHGGVGLFLEKIKEDKANACYIYEVDSRGFRHDFWTDYYNKKPVKVKKVHKIDIDKEIKAGNFNVYCFDSLDVSNINDPIAKMDLAYEHIRAKRYKKYTGA